MKEQMRLSSVVESFFLGMGIAHRTAFELDKPISPELARLLKRSDDIPDYRLERIAYNTGYFMHPKGIPLVLHALGQVTGPEY